MELSFDKINKTYNLRVLTPSSIGDWQLAIELLTQLSLKLGQDIVDEYGRSYTSQSIRQFDYIQDIEFGLIEFMKTDYPILIIDGFAHRVHLDRELAQHFLEGEEPAEAFSSFLTRIQYLDAHFANVRFYRVAETGRVLGSYTLTATTATILPRHPSVPFEYSEEIQEEEVDWQLSLVGGNDDDPDNTDQFQVIAVMPYSNFIARLPLDKCSRVDAENMLVEPLWTRELQELFSEEIAAYKSS